MVSFARRPRLLRPLLATSLVVATLSVEAPVVQAACADVSVTTTGELRTAVADANACAGPQTITILPPRTAYDDVELVVTDELSLVGDRPDTELRGAGNRGSITPSVMITVQGAALLLQDLRLTHAVDGPLGFVEAADADLQLNRVALAGQRPFWSGNGFGVAAFRTDVAIAGSTFADVDGTLLDVEQGSLDIGGFTGVGVRGTGVDVRDATATIDGFDIETFGLGGGSAFGVQVVDTSSAVVEDSQIADGPKGIGVENSVGVLIDRTAITDVSGLADSVGVVADSTSHGTKVRDTTITDATVGIDTATDTTIETVDITANVQTGIVRRGGQAEVVETFLAGNGRDCQIVSGTILDGGANSDVDDTCGFDLSEVTVEFVVDFVGIAVEEQSFFAEFDFPTAARFRSDPSKPFDVDPGWPYVDGSWCGGLLSDWFEFRRPTCSGAYEVSPVGGTMPIDTFGGLPVWGGDCRNGAGGPHVEYVVGKASRCTVTMVETEGGDHDGAAIHITERWIGDPGAALEPTVELDPVGPLPPTTAGGTEPFPFEQCPYDPTVDRIVSFEACYLPLADCVSNDAGCENFWGVPVETPTDVDVVVEAVDGWLTFFGGDCDEQGRIAAVDEFTLHRCDLVHVQDAAGTGVIFDWVIDGDDDAFGALGPHNDIAVAASVSARGTEVGWASSTDALAPQGQLDLDCAQPVFVDHDFPATCRSIVELPSGDYDLALDNDFAGTWTATPSAPCDARSVSVPAAAYTICRVDLTPARPSFSVDPTPRAVAEGTSSVRTEIDVVVTFDTPTPEGYQLRAQTYQDQAYLGLIGDLAAPWYTSGGSDLDVIDEFQEVPAGSTTSTVTVHAVADNIEELDEGFILELEDLDNGQRVRLPITLLNDDERPVIDAVSAEFDDGPSPLANGFTLVEGGGTAVSYEWTLQPSGRTWTTTEPSLDVMMVDVGTNTMTVVSTNADGAESLPASTIVDVEPTTLEISPTTLTEGDTFDPTNEQLELTGVLEQDVELQIRVSPASTNTLTTEIPEIETGCFGDADVAVDDDVIFVNSPLEDLRIETCPDDDPEREATILVELVEPQTDTVIVAQEVTIVDDDRYTIAPIQIREGGYIADLFESVAEAVRIEFDTPPWYGEAPQRYTLQGGDPVGRPCSPGDFAPGANFGVRAVGGIDVSATIVDPPAGVDVVVCGDAENEAPEELTLTLTAPDGSIDRTTVTILDDDTPPDFDTSPLLVNEPLTTATAIVSIGVDSRPYPRQVGYAWTPLVGDALPGPCAPGTPFDYAPGLDPLATILPGADTLDVPLIVCGDTTNDLDGDVRLSIARVPTSLDEILTPVVTDVVDVTIVDLNRPRIVATPVTVVEGDDGTRSAVVEISAIGGAGSLIAVDYATGGGSVPAGERATPGDDYEFTQGQLPPQPVPWTREVAIPIIGDEIDEVDESFVLEIASPNGALIVTPTIPIEIIDDDLVEVRVGSASVDEGDDAFVAISLTNPSDRPVTVEWETREGSATSGADYVTKNRTETFPAGATSRIVSIDTVDDDEKEDDETFRVFAATSHTILSSDEGTVTIRDVSPGDDVPPAIDDVDEIEVFIPVDAQRNPAVAIPIVAVDDLDGPVPVLCSPASDSAFPIGRTQVTCSATDAAGNTSSVSFDVVVAERPGIAVQPVGADAGQPGVTDQPLDPGEEIVVSATGFEPGELVVIEFRSDPVVLAEVAADDRGRIDATVEVPRGIVSGEHTIAIVPAVSDAGDQSVLIPVELTGDAVWRPLTPARVVDTRTGAETIDGRDQGGGALAAGSAITIRIGGRAGVPDDAAAVVANITAIRPAAAGFLTAHPCLDDLPLAASLNFTADVNLGNEVIIGLDDGDLCIYSSAETELTVDVVGYVPRLSATEPVAPARFLDTRAGASTVDAESAAQGPPGADRHVRVQIGGRGEVPADAAAAVMYVTAVAPSGPGFVTVWDCADDRPLASSLNHVGGVNRGNEIVAPLGSDGEVCLYTSGRVELTVDVVAYVPAASGFTSLTEPSRLLDTRPGATTVDGRSAGAGALPDGGLLTLEVAGRAGIDPGATTVTMNVTAISPSGIGFISAFACDVEPPNAASLNFVAGVNGGNEIVASLDGDGRVCLYTSTATHVSVDVTGSTTPTPLESRAR